MFDPIFIFFIWLHTQNTPMGRLSVEEVIRMRENAIIVEGICKDIKLREGI